MHLFHNGLAAQLSAGDQALLLRRCIPVTLATGQILSEPGGAEQNVYFLGGASVALLVRNGLQPGLAVGLAGSEGAVGLQFALGLGTGNLSLLVQSGGLAWRADGELLQRLVNRRSTLLRAFTRYLWNVVNEVATLAACAQIQDIEARVAGWILLSSQRSDPLTLRLTHAHIADMLGVRRASVTLAAKALKARGLLDYQRGHIQVLDWPGLRAASCWKPDLPV